MKKILLVLTALLITTSLHAAAYSKDAKFRTTKVHVTSSQPLSAGSNTLLFEIRQKGTLSKELDVAVKAFMPAMPGMPAMTSKAKAKNLGNGKYQVTVNLAMSGTWQLHIFLTPKTGKRSRVKTTLNF